MLVVAVAAAALGLLAVSADTRRSEADTTIHGWSFWVAEGSSGASAVHAVAVSGRRRAPRTVVDGYLAVAARGVSADGKRVAAARRRGSGSEVVVAGVRGGTRSLMTDATRSLTPPVWSRDGRRLATTRVGKGCGDRRSELVLVDAQTRRARTIALPNPRAGRAPALADVVAAWSPDERTILLARTWSAGECARPAAGAAVELALLTVRNRRLVNLEVGGAINGGPGTLRDAAWSPNGTLVAVSWGYNDECGLDVVRTDGRQRQPVVYGSAYETAPSVPCNEEISFAWSRKTLLFTKRQTLHAHDPATGRTATVFAAPGSLRWGCRDPLDPCPALVHETFSLDGRVLFRARPGTSAERWFLIDPARKRSRAFARPARPSQTDLLAVRLR